MHYTHSLGGKECDLDFYWAMNCGFQATLKSANAPTF